MSYRCRCVRCDKRRALRRKPKDYIRPPPCLRCGNRTYYRVKPRGGTPCNCGGYEFTHRRGSKWCKHALQTVTATEAAARWGGEPIDYVWDFNPQIVGSKIATEPDF